ncbi:MAG TPA: hypothetical protein VMU82_02375 [Acetobacteraceae bacterium]|nr:hypothetical protein [Acetobacteraceae bacterium]
MQTVLIVTVALHVLAGVFWAGSTFVLARSGGEGAEALAYPQMGAAAVVVVAGLVLWGLLHAGGFGPQEQVLALGAVCAVAAAGVQGSISLPAVRRLRMANGPAAACLRGRIALGQRLAAGLLAITVIAMATSRYV